MNWWLEIVGQHPPAVRLRVECLPPLSQVPIDCAGGRNMGFKYRQCLNDTRERSSRRCLERRRRIVATGSHARGHRVIRPAITRRKKLIIPLRMAIVEEWTGPGLNRRHTDFQSVALPTELPVQLSKAKKVIDRDRRFAPMSFQKNDSNGLF